MLRFSWAQFGTQWGILRIFREYFGYAKICGNAWWTRGWKWCRGAELNRRHTDFQSVALPTELPRHYVKQQSGDFYTIGRKKNPPKI
jgi:hypothetical protein